MRIPLYAVFMLVIVFSVLVYASSNSPEGGMPEEYKEYMEKYGSPPEGMNTPEGFNPEDMKKYGQPPEGFDPTKMGAPPEGFNYSYGTGNSYGYSTGYSSSYSYSYSGSGSTVSSEMGFPEDYEKYKEMIMSNGGQPLDKDFFDSKKDEWKKNFEGMKDFKQGTMVLPSYDNPHMSAGTTLSEDEMKKLQEDFMKIYNEGEDKEKLMEDWREKVEPFMYAAKPEKSTMMVDPAKYGEYEGRFGATIDMVCAVTAGSEGKACERLQEIASDPCSGKTGEEQATCVRAKEEMAECMSSGVNMEECAKEFSSSPEYMKYKKYECQSEECTRRYQSVSTELVVIMDMDGEVQTCRNDAQCIEDAKKKYCDHMNNKWQEFKRMSKEEKKKMMEKMKEESVKYFDEIKKNAAEVEQKFSENQKQVYNKLEGTMFDEYAQYISKKEKERDEVKAQGKDTSELDFIISQMKDQLDAARKAMTEERYKDSLKPLKSINNDLHKEFEEAMKFIEDKTDYEPPADVLQCNG